jgi:hypothetical protein
MRVLAAFVLLLSAGVTLAQELTVGEVIAAHRAGAPEEGILRLIREAPTVATLTPTDLARLRAAGVSEGVIQAMAARTAPTPTAAPVRPDDPRLADVVRLVGSGLSGESIVEQVRRSGQRYTPTVNDLVYLKQSGVPDAVIIAVLESNIPPTPAPTVAPAPAAAPVRTATAAAQTTFGPLVRMAGVFRKTSTGSLAVGGDRLEWQDAQSPALSFSLPVSGIRAVWLRSQPRGGQGTVSELCVRTTAGDDVAYRELDWAGGGEAQVLQLFHALNERFPQLILVEKPRR